MRGGGLRGGGHDDDTISTVQAHTTNVIRRIFHVDSLINKAKILSYSRTHTVQNTERKCDMRLDGRQLEAQRAGSRTARQATARRIGRDDTIRAPSPADTRG